jgi:hypothetical protein
MFLRRQAEKQFCRLLRWPSPILDTTSSEFGKGKPLSESLPRSAVVLWWIAA